MVYVGLYRNKKSDPIYIYCCGGRQVFYIMYYNIGIIKY